MKFVMVAMVLFYLQNCQVKGSDGEKYNIAAPDIITLDNCVSVTLFIPNVTEGDSFGFILNKSVRVSYTAVTGDNVEAVYSKLLQQISGDEWSGSILDGNLVLNQTDRRYGGTVVPTENFYCYRSWDTNQICGREIMDR